MGHLAAEFTPRGQRLLRIRSTRESVRFAFRDGSSRCADSPKEAKIPGLPRPETQDGSYSNNRLGFFCCQVPISLRVVSEARTGKADARARCVRALSIQR